MKLRNFLSRLMALPIIRWFIPKRFAAPQEPRTLWNLLDIARNGGMQTLLRVMDQLTPDQFAAIHQRGRDEIKAHHEYIEQRVAEYIQE